MSQTYAQTLRIHRRRFFLTLLDKTPDGKGNHLVFAEAASQAGLTTSADQAATEFAWLEAQGFVACQGREQETLIATLTRTGREVAQGVVSAPRIAPYEG